MELKKALEELRKEEKRNFNQTVDLIVNLKGFDVRKDSVNAVINIPHKIKDKKVCGFFENKSRILDSIVKAEFKKYSDKKALKKLVNEYDYFIALGTLMPAVAAAFGKVLGPAGKMPTPQLGVIMNENDESIKNILERISKAIKIRSKETSIKLSVGKESMKDEEIIENIKAVYKGIVNGLPKKNDNIKNAMIKFTMGKPLKVEI